MRSRPWTSQDAEKHNATCKGKAKLAKLWADTANGTLQSELEKKTAQKTAEGIAIATANKAVAGKGRAHMGNSGKPQRPVRTVTAAPEVQRSDGSDIGRDTGDLRIRAGQLTPATVDLDNHSVEAVLGTERCCLSMDLKTRKSFLEVYLMSGAEFPAQVPLCDTHKRNSTKKVLGSVRDIRVESDQLAGRLFVAATEYDVWSKIRDKHITDVSWGVQPLETIEIKAGKSQEVQGRLYTAPKDRSLFIHTKWRLREVSVTPIGSDERAKIRTAPDNTTNTEEQTMLELIRKWLEENMKLRTDATEEEAQTLWDSLPEADRTRAEEACREADDDEDDDDEDEEEEEDDGAGKPKKTLHRVTRQSVVTEETRAAEEVERTRTAKETERVRTEALAEGGKKQLARITRIRKLAAGSKDIPEEIVTRAIEENWSISRVRGVFLRLEREARSPTVGGGGNTNEVEMTREFSASFGIQTRNHEMDCTVASLAASLLTREYTGKQDPCDLLGGYRASASLTGEDGKPEPGQTFTVRSDVTRMLCGQAQHANEARRKAAERLLDMGDRYRGMAPLDFVDECNRIEGRVRTSYDREERVRAAFSGSALSAIFTQNVSAQFLGGYLDAEDTSMGMFTESDVPNFLQNERAIYGKMGQLKKLGKGGTAKDLDTSDWNEVYKIFRYAGKFVIDEQDFINDRFGALEQMSPQDMGLSARQIRANLLVYHLLQPQSVTIGGNTVTGNGPILNQDGYPLFCTYHNNVVTGAISDFNGTTPAVNAGPLQMATSAMGKQRLRNRVLNLRPRFAWFGNDLEWTMEILYKSQQRIIASGSGGTYNPLAAAGANLVLRQEGRFDPLGCYDNDSENTVYPYTTTGTAGTGYSGTCILAARPGEQGAKTAEVGYRTGTGRAPRIRSAMLREGSGQYGMAWDVNLDIGVRGLDFRGFQLLTCNGTQPAVGVVQQ